MIRSPLSLELLSCGLVEVKGFQLIRSIMLVGILVFRQDLPDELDLSFRSRRVGGVEARVGDR